MQSPLRGPDRDAHDGGDLLERTLVEVVEGGYCYGGEVHTSLSRVAGLITGTKWNGRRFFGLDRASSG